MNEPSQSKATEFKRSHLFVAGGVLAVVVVLLMFPITTPGRNARALGDMVHAPLFGSLTFGILLFLDRFRPLYSMMRHWVRCVVTGVAVATFGLGMESIQFLSGRTGTWHDAFANTLGVTAAACLFMAWKYRSSTRSNTSTSRSRTVSFFLAASAVGVLAVAWWPPINMFIDAQQLRTDYPLLSSFETKVELTRWYQSECELSRSLRDVTHQEFAGEVIFEKTAFPNITLTEFIKDWSNVETLELDVVLDKSYLSESANFAVSVLDVHHTNFDTDIFRKVWSLRPGEARHIVITRDEILNGPTDRQTDLNRIQYVTLLLESPIAPTKMRFDNIRLTIHSD